MKRFPGFLPLALLVTALAALAATPVWCDELGERKAVQSLVMKLFHAKDFAQLDALGTKYRTTKSRTPSGMWHLTQFYGGLNYALNADSKDPEHWQTAERNVAAWIKQQPKSIPARLSHSFLLITRAWSIRGGGYASTVRPQDWAPFKDYMEQARVDLETHKALASADPRWYELMIWIATAEQWPEARFDALVAEAWQREPAYYMTYFSALSYFTPRWGGNIKAIEAFARAAVDRTRATEGNGMYARIYWYASQNEFGDRLFSKSLVHWETMKKGIDDVLRMYPDDWNVNNFARIACLAEDIDKTAELISHMQGPAMTAVWQRTPTFQQCKLWAFSNGRAYPKR